MNESYVPKIHVNSDYYSFIPESIEQIHDLSGLLELGLTENNVLLVADVFKFKFDSDRQYELRKLDKRLSNLFPKGFSYELSFNDYKNDVKDELKKIDCSKLEQEELLTFALIKYCIGEARSLSKACPCSKKIEENLSYVISHYPTSKRLSLIIEPLKEDEIIDFGEIEIK